jgi:flagellar motor switch protein FliN
MSIDPNYPLASGAAANPALFGMSEEDFAARVASLPNYTRSLLRIRVPVKVTLASKRQAIGRVLELAPGAILHFGKPCDDPLTLSVGSCAVAVGETVKIGEKFGLRITSMVMPEEQFEALLPKPTRG